MELNNKEPRQEFEIWNARRIERAGRGSECSANSNSFNPGLTSNFGTEASESISYIQSIALKTSLLIN